MRLDCFEAEILAAVMIGRLIQTYHEPNCNTVYPVNVCQRQHRSASPGEREREREREREKERERERAIEIAMRAEVATRIFMSSQ